MAHEARLWTPEDEEHVRCRLCNHRCRIEEGRFGVCGVRENVRGKLVTHSYGSVIAAHVDPIEKKPLSHFLPGSLAFSIGTAGCNFQCGFCQNWTISRSRRRDGQWLPGEPMTSRQVVDRALMHGCRSIAYTYTEPTIFFEFAEQTGTLAHEQGLANVFVTNGFMTREALEEARPWLDACNVDLKSMNQSFYKRICKAKLGPVLDSIENVHELGIWLEVTTLVVPGQNDSDDELARIAGFLAGIDPHIPWHVSRFFPSLDFDTTPPTPPSTMMRARELGREAGLRYIYVGNMPGEDRDIRCPSCGHEVVTRTVHPPRTDLDDSRCPRCSTPIPGRFTPP
jgi:pyruvate formate lyase activating enzyme